MIHYNAFGDIIRTNKIIETMANTPNDDKGNTSVGNNQETLSIEGNLKMTGKISASSYGTINITNNGKICIGDICLTKKDLDKLINHVKK